jgi:serine-type D-Ala-D-Ala carboxypeptidase/endopeptidase (penicillin-binding protein 4)
MRRVLALLAAVAIVLGLLPAMAEAAGFCQGLRAQLVRGGGAASGLLVANSDTGQIVCRRAADTQRPLASNMKLFTTSAALDRLGPEYRVPTKVLSSGRLDSNGVLHGSLYLQGGGDPTLGTPAFYDRYLGGLGTNLLALVPKIRAAGIRSITGRLYADDTIFDRLRGVADSGYATSSYIGPLSGLSFDSGYSSAAARSFAVDPAKVAAATLAGALRTGGIGVPAAPALEAVPAESKTIAVVRSPSIDRIVNWTDVNSDNFFAETLLKLLGAHFGGAGTTAAGAAVVTQFARQHSSGVHAVDGSGLTHTNRASPSQVVGLLQSMRGTDVGEDFVQGLALAGHEGTVAERMHGTPADGHCRTKTGTLTGVSNLSGYCFNSDGKTMVFSILMGSVRDLNLAHAEQDLIAGAIAGY